MRSTGPRRSARVLASELAGVEANTGFARAVVDGMVGGQHYTWESSAGAAHHVVHPYGMSLIWGDGVESEFERITVHLRDGRYRTRDEWLQVDPRWATLPWEPELTSSAGTPTRISVHQRINFEFDASAFRAMNGQSVVPSEWSIVPADASDFRRPGSVVPANFWRSAEDFLKHGGGWRAESNGLRGALAFTSFRFGDELEIGIETHPDARGKGLATAATARMIDDLLEHDITPIWSCREDNHASVALATKLGFRPVRRLPYYCLPTAADASNGSLDLE